MDSQDYMKLIAAFEQAGACLGQFAAILGQYHKYLCESGFERDEALVLVQSYQTLILKQALHLPKKVTRDEESE